ncbi:DUF4174 domain-containing protein [Mucilaginibacter sp. CSA2-8R]|uniref:DUF4174 domain-containing protein n=1 Tax=Mucilaginibacter sp. CSA2-8R TaxID=3141542 RepID=UPI00315CF4F3
MIVLLMSILMAMPNPFQQKRQFLLFADTQNNAQLQQQLKYLHQDADGLQERDVEVKVYIKSKDPEAFANRKIKASFTTVLVGKDGGDKLISAEPITLQKLYSTIDAMPMRRSEMKRHL